MSIQDPLGIKIGYSRGSYFSKRIGKWKTSNITAFNLVTSKRRVMLSGRWRQALLKPPAETPHIVLCLHRVLRLNVYLILVLSHAPGIERAQPQKRHRSRAPQGGVTQVLTTEKPVGDAVLRVCLVKSGIGQLYQPVNDALMMSVGPAHLLDHGSLCLSVWHKGLGNIHTSLD